VMKLPEQQFAIEVQRNERVLTGPSDTGGLRHAGSVAESDSLRRGEHKNQRRDPCREMHG
jgi:hypothetical protein